MWEDNVRFESDQVITIGDIVRMKDFFEKMRAIENRFNLKVRWQYDCAIDIMDLLYTWVRSGKPPVDFDVIFLDEKNRLKKGDSKL